MPPDLLNLAPHVNQHEYKTDSLRMERILEQETLRVCGAVFKKKLPASPTYVRECPSDFRVTPSLFKWETLMVRWLLLSLSVASLKLRWQARLQRTRLEIVTLDARPIE